MISRICAKLLFVCLVIPVPLVCAEPVHYFEDVKLLKKAPESFFVTVTQFEKNSPLQRAGLEVGDKIIAVDGLRIRSMPEYLLLRLYYNSRTSIKLTFVRNGEIKEVETSDLKELRKGGFFSSVNAPDILGTLKSWKITFDEVMGVPLPGVSGQRKKDDIDDVVAAFDVAAPVPLIQPYIALTCFPAVGHEAIISLAARNDPAEREWVVNLLKVYRMLLYRKYDDASKLMASKKMLEKKVHPFLDKLAAFYSKYADNKDNYEKGVPLDKLGVDALFFALCCPYPITTVKSETAPFATDPEFQECFDKATSGVAAYEQDLNERVTRTVSIARDEADQYISLVKSAILAPVNNGGWPFRSGFLWDEKKKRDMIADLTARIDAQPSNKVECAIALIVPSLLDRDERSFKKAYGIVCDAGDTVIAEVNTITQNARSFWDLSYDFDKERREIEKAHGMWPPLYLCLADRGIYIRVHTAMGACMKCPGNLVRDMSAYCAWTPFAVAMALELPPDEGLLVDPAIRGKTSQTNQLPRIMAANLACDLSLDGLKNFSLLSQKVETGRLFDALANAMAWQGSEYGRYSRGDRVEMIDYLHRYYSGILKDEYPGVCAQVKKVNKTDPALAALMRAIYIKNGTPSVCMLIAGKLREAGLEKESGTYVNQAQSFYTNLEHVAQSPLNRAAALRDLVSVPGFADEAKEQIQIVDQSSAFAYFMLAMAEYSAGNIDGMIENVEKSTTARKPPYSLPVLVNGAVFSTLDEARARLLEDVLKRTDLTDAQKDRLTINPKLKDNPAERARP